MSAHDESIGMPFSRGARKTSITTQEEVVSVLHRLVRQTQLRAPNVDTPHAEGTYHWNSEVMGEALNDVMRAFGYRVLVIE